MSCRVCGSELLSLVLDLKDQPWANHFLKKTDLGKEPFYPLRLVYCENCCTSQLDHTVKKEVMFSDHTYLSGITKSLYAHFEKLAIEVDSRFFQNKKEKRVLDIGSNDGTQLKAYQKLGYEVLGVESCTRIAEIANQNGVPTRNSFFNLETAQEIGNKCDVINASGVFFHLEELHSVTKGIQYLLADEGVFVVQCMYIKSIMENTAFDQIYHEHLLYYSLRTLEYLLNRHGLALFDAYISPIHGGSIMGFVGHQGRRPRSERLEQLFDEEEKSKCNSKEAYLKFAENVEHLKKENLAFLEKCRNENKVVYAMGAPVKGNTLLNYFGIGPEKIQLLVEKNELRRNLYSPGMHIPLAIEKDLESPPDVYYVLAWNFKKEILENNKHLIEKGIQFYFPIDIKE